MSKDQTSNVIAFSGNTMVYESVKRFAVKGLNDLMRVLMESVDDALFTLSEKVETDHERSMYFEAMREIRLKRKLLLEKFDDALHDSFNQLILDQPVGARELQVDELSLVEQTEIEDRLAIDNMISKARPHFEDELFAVLERFKVVLHRKQIQPDQNPLDPRSICESFHLASATLETDIKVKLIFYKLFDKFVMANLGHFYHEMNEFFIQKGVLPEFKASQERMKQTTRFMANRISRSQSAENDRANKAEDSSNTRAEDTPVAGKVDGNLLAMLKQMFAPEGSPASPGMATAAGMHNPAVQSASTGSISPDAAGYMSALTRMQSSALYSVPVTQVDPQNLKTQMQQQLVSFRQQNSQQANSADNQIIDIVSMLFDFFFDDDALPDPIKVLIGRLQIPILKVAILDKSFFNHKKHPARKLLDSISRASLGWSQDQHREQVLIIKLEQIVEYLLQEFDQDIAIFEQALDQFQLFIQQEEQQIEQELEQVHAQEHSREQKIEQAQQLASAFIQGLLSRHELSFEVTDFLDGQWKSVLFNTLLTQGDESAHWQNLKRITTTLIWTLIPKHNEEDKSKLLKTLPSLLRALSRGLQLIQVDTEGQNKVFQMLVLEHAKTVRQTSKNLVTRKDDKTIWPENNAAAAFAGFNQEKHPQEVLDLLFETDASGEIQVLENSPQQDQNADSVTEIIAASTEDVIENLDQFTSCVNQGEIEVDEEIVLESSAQAIFSAQPALDSDDLHLEVVQAMAIGSWVEFRESGAKALHAKLSWKSNLTGKYVFVNRHGHKVRNMTRNGLAAEFRAGRARMIETVSVFDRAINSFMSGLGR